MEDNRTPRYDGSERHSKKAATSDKETLLDSAEARAGFTMLFGDDTVATDGIVAKPTFFDQMHVRDMDGTGEAYITGPTVGLGEVV